MAGQHVASIPAPSTVNRACRTCRHWGEPYDAHLEMRKCRLPVTIGKGRASMATAPGDGCARHVPKLHKVPA